MSDYCTRCGRYGGAVQAHECIPDMGRRMAEYEPPKNALPFAVGDHWRFRDGDIGVVVDLHDPDVHRFPIRLYCRDKGVYYRVNHHGHHVGTTAEGRLVPSPADVVEGPVYKFREDKHESVINGPQG